MHHSHESGTAVEQVPLMFNQGDSGNITIIRDTNAPDLSLIIINRRFLIAGIQRQTRTGLPPNQRKPGSQIR